MRAIKFAVVLAVLGLSIGCEDSKKVKELENQIAELKSEIASTKSELKDFLDSQAKWEVDQMTRIITLESQVAQEGAMDFPDFTRHLKAS